MYLFKIHLNTYYIMNNYVEYIYLYDEHKFNINSYLMWCFHSVCAIFIIIITVIKDHKVKSNQVYNMYMCIDYYL